MKVLDRSVDNPVILWKYIYELETAIQGPDGYETWQDAAVDERRLRVEFQNSTRSFTNAPFVFDAVHAELKTAQTNWPAFNSAHEGFGVLLEEVDELKAHVWMKQKNRDLNAMRLEAIQVAAMAVRFADEVCNEQKGGKEPMKSIYTVIPKGYRITVTSCENDADNYNTKTMDGFTKNEMDFLVDLCLFFNSKHDTPPGFGNIHGDYDDRIEEASKYFATIVAKHFKAIEYSMTLSGYFYDMGDSLDGLLEFAYDLGLTGSENYLTRVCESILIEYIPEEIKILDVTTEFIE